VRPPRRLGVAGARNYGARHAADSRVLVFSDAHVTARPGWLEPLLGALAGGAGVAAPAIRPLGGTGSWGYGCTWRDASLTTAWLRRRPQGIEEVPMVCGCFLAVDRAAFDAVGGFDDGLATWGLEDAELSLALWRSERPCVVVPEAEVEHLFRPRFHYRVAWETTLHNILRLAVVHFPEAALARVLSVYTDNSALPTAYARVLDSDVWLRRSAVADRSARDGAWFLDRFEIGALR
jgi:GT2 family glycosyltransferase